MSLLYSIRVAPDGVSASRAPTSPANTEELLMILILSRSSASKSSRAAPDFVFPSSARQICPPSRGLSSTTVTFTPSVADAATAAAIPAGPPPTIRISVMRLITCHDLHPFSSENSAAPLVRDAVDRHAAFKTDPHPAERAARPTGDRRSKFIYSRIRNRRGDRSAIVDGDRDLINGDRDQCSVVFRVGA